MVFQRGRMSSFMLAEAADTAAECSCTWPEESESYSSGLTLKEVQRCHFCPWDNIVRVSFVVGNNLVKSFYSPIENRFLFLSANLLFREDSSYTGVSRCSEPLSELSWRDEQKSRPTDATHPVSQWPHPNNRDVF